MYEPSRTIDTFYIAGFQFWDGAEVLGDLKPGMRLELSPEPDNPYDAEAVALRLHGAKLGFIPSDKNAAVSLALFYGHADLYEVVVQQVAPERSPWHQVRVALRIRDARD